jgi:flagellar protein FlaG
MDVNLNTEIKVYGAPTVPVVEQEDKVKPQVQPVQADSEAAKAKLNDQALHDNKGGRGAGVALTKTEMEKLMAQVQSRLDTIGGNLKLSLNEYKPTNDIVVQVKDRRNDKLIRQFPSEELLKLKARLEDLAGILFNESA